MVLQQREFFHQALNALEIEIAGGFAVWQVVAGVYDVPARNVGNGLRQLVHVFGEISGIAGRGLYLEEM